MLIKRARFRPAINPFTMSFLDTVSAAFGGAFFLFIIFASMPIEKSSGMLGSTEYIHLDLEWDSNSSNIELIVIPPGERSRPIRLYYDENNTFIEDKMTGMVKQSFAINNWQYAFFSGTSAYSESTSADHSDNDKFNLSFRATGPCPGKWKFFVSQKSSKNYLSNEPFKRIRFTGKLYTSSVVDIDDAYMSDQYLEQDTYLPEVQSIGFIGFNRGINLRWRRDSINFINENYIKINYENKNEPLEHCN